jgi:hypothetical protein
MKINYAIMGSNMDPMYIDFWPVVSKVWREKFNVTPVLGLICDEDSDLYEDGFGLVKKFKRIQGVDEAIQSQIVRLFLPKFLNGSCLMSDIDMIPLSVEYFKTNSEKLDDNNVIVFSSDNPECLRDNMYPICYILSQSEVFKKIFNLNVEWFDFVLQLNNRNQGWYSDQKFIYEKINNYHIENSNCLFLKRGWNGAANRRIDRMKWVYDPNKVSQGYYIDCHSLRPYSNYKNEINRLISHLYENINNRIITQG